MSLKHLILKTLPIADFSFKRLSDELDVDAQGRDRSDYILDRLVQ